MRFVIAALLILAATPAAADGKSGFQARCAGCHGAGGAGTPSAPTLKGVAGRKVAGLAGYAYSPALKAHGGTWTDAALGAYIANPQAAVKGTKMFGGAVADPTERAAIVAYLKTLK
jgi:cytochrome c